MRDHSVRVSFVITRIRAEFLTNHLIRFKINVDVNLCFNAVFNSGI